jgi:hypothetical protein
MQAPMETPVCPKKYGKKYIIRRSMMKKKIHIVCANGFSGSSVEGDNLSDVLSEEISSTPTDFDLHVVDTGRNFIREFHTVIHSLTEWDCVFLAGKSMGAYKILEAVSEDTPLYISFVLAILTVDPHYPNKADKDLPINSLIYAPLIFQQNIRQIDHYPTGAEVYGAKNITLTGCDHFSIVRRPEVCDLIHAAFFNLSMRGERVSQ